MAADIKAIFDSVCNRLTPDAVLASRLHNLQVGFVNKNKAHIEFFGGNLTGVQRVLFLPADKEHWFDLILDVDEAELTDKIHALDVVRGDNGVFKVGGDPMNLSLVWLLHVLFKTPKLTATQKHEAMVDALMFVQFKFLTSRLNQHFRFPADPAVAAATYARLSNKYAIKQHGSWIAVLKARAEDVISNTGIHYDTITRMDNDVMVVRMVSDIQGRIRDMLKNIYAVFLEVHGQGVKIITTSGTIEHDGVEVLKDNTRGLANYTNYIKSIVSDRNSFIKDDLQRVVEDVSNTASPEMLRKALEYISNHHNSDPKNEITQLLETTMLHSFTYLRGNVTQVTTNLDIGELLIRLRGIYTSSRSSDPELLALRHLCETIVRKAIHRNDTTVASVRTAVLLYIVARAFTMRHYTNYTAHA